MLLLIFHKVLRFDPLQGYKMSSTHSGGESEVRREWWGTEGNAVVGPANILKNEYSSPGSGVRGVGGCGAEGGRDIPRQQDKYEFYNGS